MLSDDKIVLAGAPPPRPGDASPAQPPKDAGPSTPALRALRGRVPLVHLVRGPWSADRPRDPAYELVVFEDGTVAYEGHRCVSVGGLVLRRLDAAALAELRKLLDHGCVDLDQSSADEICVGEETLAVACVNHGDVLVGNDRCVGGRDSRDALQTLAARLEDGIGVADWLGAPTDRQACDASAADLAPGEIARTVGPPARAAHRLVSRSGTHPKS